MDRASIDSFLRRDITSPRKRMSLGPSSRRQSSGVSLSGRSTQSVQVICRSASHIVESFGSSLPVLVTEALTFVERNTAVSVSVSQNGWAWLVCGRRLLVWQCKTTLDPKQRPTFKSQCRELQLPQSDLAHKAECIAVWLPPGHQVPSCMAVSPEGIVRYWSSVAHEESSVETSAELAGQEVDCLTHIPSHGCILATTTCTVALLQPQFTNARNTITCRVLRTSQGWLGGIGRRMSSLIFGAMPQSQSVMETKLAKVTCTSLGDRSRVLILAGSSLQYWSFPLGEQEKMEFDEDVGHIVSQEFQKHIWNLRHLTPENMETWLIDMQTCDEGIVLLVAANSSDTSPSRIHFALGLLPLNGTSLTNSFKWFLQLKVGPLRHQDDTETAISSFRFILSGWEAIVYNSYTVLVVNTTNEHEQDKIDLVKSTEDKILGGSLCSGAPILFTRNSGLVTITRPDFAVQDFNSSFADANTSVDYTLNSSVVDSFNTTVSNDKLREMYLSSNGVHQLIAAFMFSCRQNRQECEQILAELFPYQEEPVMDIDAMLDTLVLDVGKRLIDDFPANDPRWSNHMDTSITMAAVSSMQIPHQLDGKHKAVDLFVAFLKDYNLWNRFCAVTYRGIIMSTSHVLGEYAEKIVAALAIYNLQNQFSDILDSIIEETLNPESFLSPELSAKDVFYREVSTVHLVLPALVASACDVTQSDKPIQQVSHYILRINSILLGVLREVIKYRQNNADRFVPSRSCNAVTEYLPWTAATGKNELRTCLYTMENLTLKHGVTGTNDSAVMNELYDQVVGLIDLILDGRKCHLESIRGTEKFDILLKQYETERANLIQPLIKNEQYENAAMLAEKYFDFASLVQICELTDNKSRLDSYSERFADQDFVGFLFSWYVKDGRQGQLVERCRRGGAGELTEKLSEHPELSWVQESLTGEYRQAAHTLSVLANEELELVKRKKTKLSLSKLALLCSDEPEGEIADALERINSELELIAYQEELPNDVLETYGYDTDKLRVLKPVELINFYTCEENALAGEFDFKKALDLLNSVPDADDKKTLKLRIWARAARRDKWDAVTTNPEVQIQKTLFFKLMDLNHTMGDPLEECLPPIDDLLLESELGPLAVSSNFQYLIKLVYEYSLQHFKIRSG
ncbi:nuclear pore complex protein Nup133 [Diachasmimorpha longicaudata]|uniref:nuclear pore complex protein Nup133 n=1 Tax=Diachasmimorpha longicaudata TaxID=58733 RepID=UPI0030B8D44A